MESQTDIQNFSNADQVDTVVKRGRKCKYDKDKLQDEIDAKKRCRQCRRQTDPETDYKNIRSGGETRLCFKCRDSAVRSIRKNGQSARPKRITMKEKIEIYERVIKSLPVEILEKIKSNTKLPFDE